MKKKIGIFDIDGTLVDAYDAITRNFNYALKSLGYPSVSIEQVKRAVGGGSKLLAAKFVRPEHIEEFLKIYNNNHTRFLKGRVRLMKGSEELLKFLTDRGLLLGVATNRSRSSVPPVLEELKIDKYFDIICTADDVANPKPDPSMILYIMDTLKAKKEESFYIGDMVIDFLTGKNAGVDTYILATGSSPRDELEEIKGINLFDNLCSLKDYLNTVI